MSKNWKPMEWERVEQLEDHYVLREELRQTRIAYNKDIDNLIQAEQHIQQLEHLREIAIDVEACLEPGVASPVPEFMLLAFTAAITRTAELGEAPAELEKED